MTDLRAAAQQALEALCSAVEPKKGKVYARGFEPIDCYAMHEQAITALREALKQPEQRKPLTDKDILADKTLRYYFGQNGGAGPVSKQGRKVVDAIEAAHGIKEET